MTAQIPKSKIWPEFELDVAVFAQAMRDWRGHMGRVGDDERNGVRGAEKHVAYPRPIAHVLVDEAVDENGNPDYEIVDDGPTAEQIVAFKKGQLFNAVIEAERAASEIIVPFAKRRLFNLREASIRNEDGRRALDLSKKKGRLSKMWDAALGKEVEVSGVNPADIRELRSDDENEFLDAQDERRARLAALELESAQALADIQDLTADDIDSWKIPDFKV